MISTKKIKIALVHDDFIQFGGAEKLFYELVREFSNDDLFDVTVFSSLISPKWKEVFLKDKVTYCESFLKYLPFSYLYSRLIFLTNLFYLAFQDFNFDDYDFVFSSSTRFGHALVTKPNSFHISYINSPSRALWDERKYFFNKYIIHKIFKNLLPNKRVYDFFSQQNSDLIISNSKNIRSKVKKIYQRNSIILFPFVNLDSNMLVSKNISDYFLIVSRLVSWKRIDFVIEAFNLNSRRLIVIGDGNELEYYKKVSKPNIEFKGYVTEEEKKELFLNSQALLFPQDEDFGITILEALNSRTPIIYLNKGGAKEILNNKVGISFEDQNAEAVDNALSRFSNFEFDSLEAEKILSKYSKNTFVSFVKKLVFIIKR
jgi:glycosyltransferase involved in cell wall biosynthesis